MDGRVLEVGAVCELLADVVLGALPRVQRLLADEVGLGAGLPEVLDVHIPALRAVSDVPGSVVDNLTHLILGIKAQLVVPGYHYFVLVRQLK